MSFFQPKGMTPNRNLKAPNQLKIANKGMESPVSMGNFVQKNIISKEKKFSSSLSSSVGLRYLYSDSMLKLYLVLKFMFAVLSNRP